jgi:predicted metal-dependent HD superfamily phosphohydrolase
MNYQLLINQAEVFVKKYMREHDNPGLPYHNYQHTQTIVSVTDRIAKYYELKEEEFFIVVSASWFLHLGNYKDRLHPEEPSAVEEETIHRIKKCILATKNHHVPNILLEKIICDSNSSYLAAEDFARYNKLRRKEFELRNNATIDKSDWRKRTIQLFEAHRYHTDYCKDHLNKNKMKNLLKLKKKDPFSTSSANPVSTLAGQISNIETNVKSLKGDINSPARTIETMFRITSTNSQRLSVQADAKAHILISVNTIIISVLFTVIVRKMNEYAAFMIPVIILLLVALATVIFSILATKPGTPKGVFSHTDVKQHKVNLLFFGNFYNMDFDQYCKSMLEVMNDRQFLYINLLRNLHEHGVVLGKKYKLLKIAYNVFMYGLSLSVIAFLVAAVIVSAKS